MRLSILDKLHRRSWDCTALEEILQGFIGGQFQIIKKIKGDEAHLRGEIREIKVSRNSRKVLVSFNWLCEERLVHNWKLEANLKWFLMERPFGDPCLEILFDAYRSHPDEDRVKMWGGGWSEVCRFYKKDDHTNLVRNGDDIVPYWELHKLSFFHAIRIALKNK